VEALGDALLCGGAEVCLVQKDDFVLTASLSITAVGSVTEGRELVATLVSTKEG